jgi:von Willebrand factor type A domain
MNALLACLLFAAASPSTSACRDADAFAIAPQGQKADDRPVKALQAWLRAYRSGKVDFRSQEQLRGEIIAEKFGLAPKSGGAPLTAETELHLLLEKAAASQSAAAAEVIVTVAAIGLDHGKVKYAESMAPSRVRALGERFVQKLTEAAAIETIRKLASGEEPGDKTFGAGVRAASIRALAAKKDVSARKLCESQLRAADLPVRLSAAEALALVADAQSADALAAAIDAEKEPSAMIALVAAARACLAKWIDPQPEPSTDAKAEKEAKPARPGSLTAASAAAARAIGRSDWRADMELCAFVGATRDRAAVPSLITVLQRFSDHPEQVQSGALSTLLLYRAHETLVALTGAVLPASAPAQWRQFWEQEQQKLLAEEPKPAATSKSDGKTVAFCGIPAQGSRILFVIDLSGSMEFAMKALPGEDAADTQGGGTRLAFAKRQMHKVIAEIPAASKINFITFNGRPKARVWSKELVEANDKNKKKALEFVDSWTATYPPPNQLDGGTNMWSGLEEALTVTTQVYGEAQDTTIDEIFVVSDGAPSVGEILDPLEILRLVNDANRFTKIRINTIFITSTSDRDPRDLSLSPSDLMRRMAQENGGRFVEFKD